MFSLLFIGYWHDKDEITWGDPRPYHQSGEVVTFTQGVQLTNVANL